MKIWGEKKNAVGKVGRARTGVRIPVGEDVGNNGGVDVRRENSSRRYVTEIKCGEEWEAGRHWSGGRIRMYRNKKGADK